MCRMLALLALLTIGLMSGIDHLQASSAAAWRVYTNAAHAYSLSYPADWLQSPSNTQDLLVEHDNYQVVFSAFSARVTSASDTRRLAEFALEASEVNDPSAIRYTHRSVRGVTYLEADYTGPVYGEPVQATVRSLVTYRAHIEYAFTLSLVTSVAGKPRPVAPADARTLARIVASIRFMGQ